MVIYDQVDFVIVIEVIFDYKEFVLLFCFQWYYVVVVLVDYLLFECKLVMFDDFVQYLLIMYDDVFVGCKKINYVFVLCGLLLDIVFEVIDVDVIKIYVEFGFGVGIMVDIVFNFECDCGLWLILVGYLFGSNVMCVVFKQGVYLCSYVYMFVELLLLMLNCKLIEQVFKGEVELYEF